MSFQEYFHSDPQLTAESHGRVNLIGEHTDYNQGYVFPALIPQKTTISGRARQDLKVVAVSKDLGKVEYEIGGEKKSKEWSDYILGVTHTLAWAGHQLCGLEIYIESSVPIGSGLSSSAALIVALMRFIRQAARIDLSDQQIPALCQSVENNFVGARVGIMDPTACALAQEGHALFVDTRSMQTENIPMPEGAELLVINSGISHRHAGGGYNERRAQCEEAAQILGVLSLRELFTADLGRGQKELSEIHYKRIRHVVTENERVLSCLRAFQEKNLELAGDLFNSSHISMRDDYEVSIPEIDWLVDLAQQEKDIYGARLTGGGFGGSIVALAKKGEARSAGARILEKYQEKTSSKAHILVP
jgi:galactokinase